MPKLAIDDQLGRREVDLKGEVVLGRAPDCDVVVLGPQVSRRHAKITVTGNALSVEDLGSSNGTSVNGTRISKQSVQPGDTISLGDCKLELIADDGGRPKTAVNPLSAPTATVVGAVDVRPSAEEAEALDKASAAALRQRLKVLREVAEASCGSMEIKYLVQGILDQLLHVFPQADHAHAILYGFGDQQADLCASAHREGKSTEDAGISKTLLETATREQKAVLARDIAGDDRFSAAQSILIQEICSVMCSPLVVGSELLGAIQVDTTSTRPFTEDDLRLLVAMAGQLAVAAENVRLHREVVAQQRLAAIGEAISGIAHCMKNVLQAVEGGSYVLDLGLKGQDFEKVDKGWSMVKRNSEFMSGLVRDMLTYCKKGSPVHEPTDLGQLLDDTVMMIQEKAARDGVETSLEVTGDAPTLPADATGLKRVLLNLLTNAVEACSEDCRVRMLACVEEGGKHYRISVEDNGPGIPEDVQKRLFEPFFTTKGGRGTGLGLALVQKVITEHGGRVELDSEVGRGTVFHLFLPIEGPKKAATA